MRRPGLSLAIAIAGLAVIAPSAPAVATRAEYSAAVNPICQSTNTQIEQVYVELQAKLRRFQKQQKKNGNLSSTTIIFSASESKRRGKGQRADPFDAFKRLYFGVYEQVEAIQRAEVAQLRLVTPAPGDDSLVSSWVSNREAIINLNELVFELEEKSFDLDDFPRSVKKFKTRDRRMRRKIARLYQQIVAANKVDLEYGTQLGATYCVTGANGGFAAAG